MREGGITRLAWLIRMFTVVAGVLAVIGVAAALWHVGWLPRQFHALGQMGLEATGDAHFVVKDVVVEGRRQTGRDELAAALDATVGDPILAFSPDRALKRIMELPWVASAVVERRLPDVIYVWLDERVPLARWQRGGRTIVIDADGKDLATAVPDSFTSLPLVVGAGAAEEAGDLLSTLRAYPAVSGKMTAAVRVGERRWDIHLYPRIIARMPENGLEEALGRLSQLIADEKILDRDIAAVDLRFPGRLIIEPGNSSAVPSTPTAPASRSGDAR